MCDEINIKRCKDCYFYAVYSERCEKTGPHTWVGKNCIACDEFQPQQGVPVIVAGGGVSEREQRLLDIAAHLFTEHVSRNIDLRVRANTDACYKAARHSLAIAELFLTAYQNKKKGGEV